MPTTSWFPMALGATLCGIYWFCHHHYIHKPKILNPKKPVSSPIHSQQDDETSPLFIDKQQDSNETSLEIDESQALLSLLYSFAQEQYKNQAIVHRSITCNHCNTSPVRGIRFKCCNCDDFDLCEACEALDVHVKTHIFLKIRIPVPPLANPRIALCPRFYPGMDFNSSTPRDIDWEALSLSCHCNL